MWRSPTFWWPLQHLTPLSGCGSAVRQKKVKTKPNTAFIHSLRRDSFNFFANSVFYYVELVFFLPVRVLQTTFSCTTEKRLFPGKFQLFH